MEANVMDGDRETMKNTHILYLLMEILVLLLKVIYYIFESMYHLIVPLKKKNVAGEIVLITGAGHGIGKELAIGYASLGATVVCWDINEKTNNETMNDIKKIGRQSVYAYKCDVANREEVFRVAEKVKKEVGDVTILVNNAGIAFVKSFQNHSLDEIARVIDVNVTAQYWTLKAFLPSMIKNNYGHIVALSSVTAFIGAHCGTVYCPTKSATKVLMEAMSEELRALSNGKSSIKFTTVYPTLVHTGMCKKPKIRFPRIMGGLSPQYVASAIIDAQRRNYKDRSIPFHYLFISNLIRYLPDKALLSILDFFDSGVYPED
ncbi:PREDICTED: short-chain dehydrogenase/reductase family 16C member 6-like [Wasmannia auropunctata]|uniref:short-chain dehydrogenase/reductase family 16C member 6-like n=1 Tax=Wasmannia auropunctata TaxID=64793 RepID=UPI0005F0B524|nr:PREDICTED: short-chain dehydrogenase/reductase family 16C member 6-like [Wasmannia auropunctata]